MGNSGKPSKAERKAMKQKRRFLRDNGEVCPKMPCSTEKRKRIVPLQIHGDTFDIG